MEKWELLLVDLGGRVLGALLILVVGWIVMRFCAAPLRRLLGKSRLDPSAASFVTNTARGALLAAILLAAVHQLGVETVPLLTLVGAVGLAIGVALQGSLANFASGLLLLSFRTVRVGDWIEVGDARGQVRDMYPFYIVLVTQDNQLVTVPNTLLTNGVVRNGTLLPVREARWTLTASARDDLAAVKEALRARLRADRRVLPEPPPEVVVQEWTDDRRVLAVTAWTAAGDRPAVQAELLEALGAALEAARRPS